MAITSISRDWGVDPSVVRITTPDSLTTIIASGYLTAQEANIEALNNGAFEWVDGDLIAIDYSDGEGFFTRDATNNTFVANTADEQLLQHAQVDVALADFIGSYSASLELLPAPGVGKKIILNRAVLSINYGGTVLADGGAVQIQYNDTVNAGGVAATNTQAAATLIAATVGGSGGFTPVDTGLPDDTTLNKGLYLATATADFTGGTDSTYKVDLWYSVINVA